MSVRAAQRGPQLKTEAGQADACQPLVCVATQRHLPGKNHAFCRAQIEGDASDSAETAAGRFSQSNSVDQVSVVFQPHWHDLTLNQ
jgi:hypothetical protein